MKKIIPSLIFLVLIISSTLTVQAITLNLTVTTNEQYSRYEEANILGSLTEDGNPVVDGLVALQISDPNGGLTVIRTVNTGANPQDPIVVEIRSVHCSDAEGNPVNNVERQTLAFFTAEVYNNHQTQSQFVRATVNIFDNDNSPIGSGIFDGTILPRQTATFTVSVPIPSWAQLGRATVFAGAYTGMPNAGGVPYCTEKTNTFTIGGTQGDAPPTIQSGNAGAYTLNFRIPRRCPTGEYTVYASSKHNSVTTSATTTFDVLQPGDFNGDGDIDIGDITAFIDAYIAYWSGGSWDTRADLDFDGAMDIADVTAFVDAYITYWGGN